MLAVALEQRGSAMHAAAREGQLKVAQILIDRKADVHATDEVATLLCA